jgi:hypothetical protein
MVVGFDVCHEPGSKTTSYGALVASLDKAMSRYFSAVSVHSSGEEVSNNIRAHMASKSPGHTFGMFLAFITVSMNPRYLFLPPSCPLIQSWILVLY